MSLPLHEKKILVTRERSQAKTLSDKILKNGGTPVEIPLLKISCKKEVNTENTLRNLSNYRWIFFTSINGVQCFFKHLNRLNISVESLKKMKIAVVGRKTGQALNEYGLSPAFIPTIYNAENMADEFLQTVEHVEPILIVRGNRSRNVLLRRFNQLNIPYQTIEVYETASNVEIRDQLEQTLKKNEFDFITFTSPSAVEAYMEMANRGSNYKNTLKTNCVCIGTTTEQRANELGFVHTITPYEFTVDGMIECMSKYLREDN
ncbi:uroporphyrinogen-III synthase [Ornithinibacillus salinisoli]|uniref:Uroporphyrinogen-III synthase n=1 Tax=Ornithinibacillus salinisoli TaxID=1848459 RepID=A0ABW4W3E3_9BACI